MWTEPRTSSRTFGLDDLRQGVARVEQHAIGTEVRLVAHLPRRAPLGEARDVHVELDQPRVDVDPRSSCAPTGMTWSWRKPSVGPNPGRGVIQTIL